MKKTVLPKRTPKIIKLSIPNVLPFEVDENFSWSDAPKEIQELLLTFNNGKQTLSFTEASSNMLLAMFKASLDGDKDTLKKLSKYI